MVNPVPRLVGGAALLVAYSVLSGVDGKSVIGVAEYHELPLLKRK
jgi:hypothetical protein